VLRKGNFDALYQLRKKTAKSHQLLKTKAASAAFLIT
jgi:hypothetical protein